MEKYNNLTIPASQMFFFFSLSYMTVNWVCMTECMAFGLTRHLTTLPLLFRIAMEISYSYNIFLLWRRLQLPMFSYVNIFLLFSTAEVSVDIKVTCFVYVYVCIYLFVYIYMFVSIALLLLDFAAKHKNVFVIFQDFFQCLHFHADWKFYANWKYCIKTGGWKPTYSHTGWFYSGNLWSCVGMMQSAQYTFCVHMALNMQLNQQLSGTVSVHLLIIMFCFHFCFVWNQG